MPTQRKPSGTPAGKKIDAPAGDAPISFRRTSRQAAGRGMPSSQRASVIQFLPAVRPVVGPTDSELLGCFVAHRDGTAFAELVRRHGAMVYGTAIRPSRHVWREINIVLFPL